LILSFDLAEISDFKVQTGQGSYEDDKMRVLSQEKKVLYIRGILSLETKTFYIFI